MRDRNDREELQQYIQKKKKAKVEEQEPQATVATVRTAAAANQEDDDSDDNSDDDEAEEEEETEEEAAGIEAVCKVAAQFKDVKENVDLNPAQLKVVQDCFSECPGGPLKVSFSPPEEDCPESRFTFEFRNDGYLAVFFSFDDSFEDGVTDFWCDEIMKW